MDLSPHRVPLTQGVLRSTAFPRAAIAYQVSNTHRLSSVRLGTFHLELRQVYYTCSEMAHEAKPQLKLNLQRSTPAARKRVYIALLSELSNELRFERRLHYESVHYELAELSMASVATISVVSADLQTHLGDLMENEKLV